MIVFKIFPVLCSITLGHALLSASKNSLTLLNGNFPTTANESTNATTPDNPLPLVVRCSGQHFGWSPSISDCESAKANIVPEVVQYTWGERRTGLSDEVFPLPFRVMGGELTAVSFGRQE